MAQSKKFFITPSCQQFVFRGHGLPPCQDQVHDDQWKMDSGNDNIEDAKIWDKGHFDTMQSLSPIGAANRRSADEDEDNAQVGFYVLCRSRIAAGDAAVILYIHWWTILVRKQLVNDIKMQSIT